MAIIERDFGLKADAQGFLLGVKKLGQDVAQIDTNVERILDILGNHAPVKDFKQALNQSRLTQNTAKIAANSDNLLQSQKQVVTLLSSRSQGQRAINNTQGQNEQDVSQQSQIISADSISSNNNNNNASADNNQSPLPQQTGEQNTDSQSPQIINNERVNNRENNSDIVSQNNARQRDSRGRFVGSGDTAPPVVDLNHPNRPPQSPPSVQPPSPTEQSPNGQPPTEPPAPVQEPPSSGSNDTEKKGFLGKIVQAIKNGFSSDTSSIDPSIEAMREVGQLLAPLRPFGFRSKEKNKPLSREEERHNRRQIRLLERIARMSSRGGSSGGNSSFAGGLLGGLLSRGGGLLKGAGGLLGGLLKKGLGGLGGLLKFGKGIPLIGTALSALTLSDWDKQNTQQRGESVGSISGGVIGGALGSVLGPVGTIAGAAIGSWLGEKLGGIVAPKISEWTDSLIKADIPKRISNAWDTFTSGLSGYIKEKINNIKENTKELVNDAKDTVGSVGDFSAYQTDRFLAKLGNKEAIERLAQRDRGEIGFTPQNYKAKTTNNTSLGQVVADTGEALTTQPLPSQPSDIEKIIVNKKDNSNTVQLADGSIVKRTGNRNWRNNNPGNLEYGDIAKKHGAIGSDGRFAIFPSYEAGRAAKSDLIFNGENYKDLDLMGAISRYAPPTNKFGQFENDTPKYQRTVLSAVGGVNKRMADYTPDERERIMDAMEKMEGYRKGKEQVLQAATQQPSQAKKQPIATINKTNAPIVNGLTTTPLAMLPKAQAPAFSLMRPTQKITTNPTAISQTQHKIAAPQIPKPESVKEPIGTPSPMMVRNVDNGQQITQNLSDRHLAHLVTGGLGMTDRWTR